MAQNIDYGKNEIIMSVKVAILLYFLIGGVI